MANTNLKIVFGGAVFNNFSGFSTPEKVEEVLKALETEGINVIDTARAYGTSEELLGHTNAASRFTVDTKYPGGLVPGESTKEIVIAAGEESLKKLKTDCVDIYYIHAPDRVNPMEPILAAVNELYKAGKFKRFGISNFRADEVEKVIRIGKQNNYILPSVYQGNYSAVARLTEKELFPTLRKYNIAFYAYSPIAGGFLTKSPKQLMDGGQGRWDPSNFLGQLYGTLYKKPAMLKALEMWGEIAKDLGISKAELAYRWVAFNSHIEGELGDAIIIGARTIEQLKETLAGLRNGPLSEDAVGKIDELWKTIEHVSPLDNYNNYISLQQELAVMK